MPMFAAPFNPLNVTLCYEFHTSHSKLPVHTTATRSHCKKSALCLGFPSHHTWVRFNFAGDNVIQSTDIHWTVTQILVPSVYIIAPSQVSNHWLQAMFRMTLGIPRLAMFASKNRQVVQIQIRASHVEAVLERWSLQPFLTFHVQLLYLLPNSY